MTTTTGIFALVVERGDEMFHRRIGVAELHLMENFTLQQVFHASWSRRELVSI